MSDRKDLDHLLDEALEGLRETLPDSDAEQAVADRVWARIDAELCLAESSAPASHQIRDCSDFQALIPAHLRGGLNEARALLLEDHLGECLSCRRAMKQAKAARKTVQERATAQVGQGRFQGWAWKVAVAAALFIALVGLNVQTDLFSIRAGGTVRVESLSGEAFRVTEEGAVPLKIGDEVRFEDVSRVRTAGDSSLMLRMSDNSLVEVNERADLAVQQKRKWWSSGPGDSVIDLARGSIIVEASDQGSGHLYVDTVDCRVTVTGTVFAVNHGVKGSRVSVIEGEVEVDYAAGRDVLNPGEQSTTRRDLARIPVEREIAWSQNLDRHLALLNELSRVTKEIEREVQGPGLRYSTRLLDRAPENTVIYIGVPNVSTTLHDSYALLQTKIASNDLLRDWWAESVAGSGADEDLARVMDKIKAYGDELGDEIAVTLQLDSHDLAGPILMAELRDPAGLRALIEGEKRGVDAGGGEALDLYILDEDGGEPADGDDGLYLWLGDDLVVGAVDAAKLRGAVQRLGSDGAKRFGSTGFHNRLNDLYVDGVEWVVGVDLQSIAASKWDHDNPKLERLGLLDLQHLIGEHKESGDRVESRLALTFAEPRRGIVSWLAEPAPMGALEFITSDSKMAAAVLMEEPAVMVDQLLELLGDGNGLLGWIEAFEQDHDIDIRQDIAAALGGEFALALDGPLLPTPSWKLVLEVYDPERLQATLDWAVGRLEEVWRDANLQGVRIERSQVGGQTYFELKSLDTGLSAHYTFIDGYMVTAPSRVLLTRTLQMRDNGLTLVAARSFTSLLPSDGQVNFSAAFYEDLGALVGPLAQYVGQSGASLSPEQQRLLQEAQSHDNPSLTLLYGERDRITAVTTGRDGLISSAFGSLPRLEGLRGMQQLWRRGAPIPKPVDRTSDL